jgi:DNA polymerase III epsilon subunit-like protein
MSRCLVFDTETTGLVETCLMRDDQQPALIEFYGEAIGDDDAVIEELDFLCNPGRPITDLITRITGLADADVAQADRFKARAQSVKALIESCDQVVAHNLSFDMAMINIEMARCHMAVEWPALRLCTVEATEWMQGFRLSLEGLHEALFGEGFPAAHRARNDVKALSRCFIELRRRGDV